MDIPTFDELRMTSPLLLELLERVRIGELSVADAAQRLAAQTHTAHTDDAAVDLDRQRRCGFPEVVYGRGKTSAAIVEIFRTQIAHGQDCFATLVSPEQAQDVLAQLPDVIYNPTGRTLRLECPGGERPAGGTVAVITAGTSDRPIAEEACETLRWMGCELDLIVDVGVAGPHRLVAQRHRFVDADAVIVIAGMEGALPSVVGGHVDCPVIAIPTSVGYGASFNGVAALLGMLNSCASNVVVVNIDSGFKGAYVAGLIARRTAKARLG
jgi:NCAIR mutase (PurE)-related protein